MDLTPKTLREVVFREKLRGGYHPDDVDEFLEQVATGVEELHERLRQALDRAQRAEAGAPSGHNSGADAEEAVRTLVLAQRTADMAVQEARQQAAKVLASAELQAQTMAAAAEERRRRHEEATLAGTRDELTKLETARAKAQQEAEALNRWIEEHKAHLRSVLRDALSVVDRSGVKTPPPTSHPIEGVRREPAAPQAVAPQVAAPQPVAPQPAAPQVVAQPRPEPNEAKDANDDAAPEPARPAPAEDAHNGPRLPSENGPKVNATVPSEAPTSEHQIVHASVNAEALYGAGAAPAGGGGAADPDEQALDEFFDDPEFDDDRRFGGRLRRKR